MLRALPPVPPEAYRKILFGDTKHQNFIVPYSIVRVSVKGDYLTLHTDFRPNHQEIYLLSMRTFQRRFSGLKMFCPCSENDSINVFRVHQVKRENFYFEMDDASQVQYNLKTFSRFLNMLDILYKEEQLKADLPEQLRKIHSKKVPLGENTSLTA